MTFTLSIVVFFVALIAIIMIHEFGHYLLARAFGFRVLEYFVGFGPRLWSFRRGEIEYGVKAIPAGGYVKIAGMNPLEDDVPPGDEDRAYFAKPIWQRALVILAGPLSHFLVALLIFSAVFMLTGEPDPAAPWRLSSVAPTLGGSVTPAASAGLRPGDLILQIGDVRTPDSEQISELFLASIGTPVAVVVRRGDEELSFAITPKEVVEDGVTRGRIGVTIEPSHLVTPGVGEAIGDGAVEVWTLTGESVVNLGRVFGPEGIGRTFSLLFSDAPRPVEGSAESVVGIGRRFGTYGERGQWVEFLYLFGYVTLFIGLINLIPLPPLDGGHVAVLAIEKVRGRRVDMRKLIPVSAVVLTFLVLFTMATVALDIFKPVSIAP